jgi:HD superfamily phosphohydrolase
MLDLAPDKTIRIAVSGDVRLTRLEVRLIDTADFQRLRRIRQLGGACWVYPSAVHTRFDHSLGVLSMAELMVRALRLGDDEGAGAAENVSTEQEALGRLLALLHDATHIPFGHTLEDEFALFPRHDQSDRRVERFFGPDSEMGRILRDGLGNDLHQRFMRLLRAAIGTADSSDAPADDFFLLDLIRNSVCADLLDYLQRDAYFCNIRLETDIRFLSHLALARHEGRCRLYIRLWKAGKAEPRRSTLNELIRLLDNRYLMGERVYFHHAKLVAGAMIAGAVARAMREGDLTEEGLYDVGDEELLAQLRQSRNSAARRLAENLSRRALWKMAFHRSRSAFQAEQQSVRSIDMIDDIMRRHHRDALGRAALEDRIADLLGMESGDVLLYCPHHDMALKPADALVSWNGALRPLKDCTDDELVGARLQSILDSHQNLWAVRAFLNPRHLDRRDAVADAFESLFSYESARKRRLERNFYGGVLRRLALEPNGRNDFLPEDKEKRLDAALNRVLGAPDELRTVDFARRNVRDVLQS